MPPSNVQPLEPLLTTAEVAKLVKRTEWTVKNWRRSGVGPKFVHQGRFVMYRQSAIEQWLEENEVDPVTAGVG